MNKQLLSYFCPVPLQYLSLLIGILVGINSGVVTAQEEPNINQWPQNELTTLATTELQSARSSYERGNLEEAIAFLQAAINAYEKEGDVLKLAYALRNLSLIYLQLGNWQATEVNIERARELSSKIDDRRQRHKLLNLCLEIQGQLHLAKGQPEVALTTWEKSSELAYQRGDWPQFVKSQVKQVEALQELGMYGQAVKILTQIGPKLDDAPQNLVTAKAWQTIGDVWRKVGKLEEAESSLEKGLAIAEAEEHPEARADLLLSLGHVFRAKANVQTSLGHLAGAQQELQRASQLYQRAAQVSNDSYLQVQALLAQLNLEVAKEPQNVTSDLITTITEKIELLVPDKNSVNQRISLAVNLLKIPHKQYQQLIWQQLTAANQQAQQLQYQRGEANANGNLGRLYQREQRSIEARKLSERALLIAQQIKAPDLAYQWQWQLGQIMQQQGDRQGAISAYSQAVNTLTTLRSDLVAVSSDLEFNFRENVEPVYRELVSILLRPEATPDEIGQARDVIEALQLAELNNFFREACLDAQPQQIDQLDPQAAVIYSIVLPGRLAAILSLPGKPLSYYETSLTSPDHEASGEIERVFDDMFANLNPLMSSIEPLRPHQQFYDWLIRPLAAELEKSGIKTLVFVLDGVLRSLPMAALHDGQQYLIEKYNLALTPGLQLLTPRALSPEQLRTLAAGLAEARQGFSPLPGVKQEVKKIAEVVSAEVLLDQDFTRSRLQRKIEAAWFPVVHLATHGQFSSQAEDTFLLTWDERINVKNLDQLLREREGQEGSPIELLILSACQTAAGDKRAVLGLAGVAVRSGARSTLATLWSVQDQSTADLMSQFYETLSQPGVSKAEALRQAQLSLLRSPQYQHPFYWAPFVLVGNWL